MELWKLTGAAADALERRPGRPREAEAQAGPGRPREAQPGEPREARQAQEARQTGRLRPRPRPREEARTTRGNRGQPREPRD